MEIRSNSEVVDKNGKVLGKVDYIIRNSWTGEISKFIIYRQPPEGDLAFSPQDVLEVTESRVKVAISSDA